MNEQPRYGEKAPLPPIPEPKPKSPGSRIVTAAGTILVTSVALGAAALIILGVIILWRTALS